MSDHKSEKRKKTIYQPIKGVQGVRTIWDWNPETYRYEKRKTGLRYYAFKKINGLQRSKSYETFDQASDWRRSESFFDESDCKGSIPFADVKAKFFEHKKDKLRVTTLETYLSSSKHLAFFDQLPMSQLTAGAIDAWLREVKKPSYLENHHGTRLSYEHELSILRQILVFYSEYLADWYQVPIKKRHRTDCIVDAQKFQEAKSKAKTKYIPRSELELFIDAMKTRAERKPKYRVYHLLALFQVRTGARIGEACAITNADLDMLKGLAKIWQTVQWARTRTRKTCICPLTKTGEQREVPLPVDLVAAVIEWIRSSGRASGLIFSMDGVKPLSYRSIQYHYNEAFKMAGLSWASTHILRHSFATDFLECTRNRDALQGILGHQSSRQTDHYAKITDSLKQDGMKQYEHSLAGAKVLPFTRPLDALNGNSESWIGKIQKLLDGIREADKKAGL